ncbi:MAG: hypothetical protein IJM37_00585 [Lachnospiraceae bacterium]|nr:hypothetical protein [Lachnospiraceae bacterium]
MKKILSVICLITFIVCFIGCNKAGLADAVYDGSSYKAVLQQYIEQNDNIGAEFPQIYFMNGKYTVAASYFGLFVIDNTAKKVDSFIDLKKYDCNYFQGDVITKISSDDKSEKLYFYNTENDKIVADKVYSYDIKSRKISKAKAEEIGAGSVPMQSGTLRDVLDEADEDLAVKLSEYADRNISTVYKGNEQMVFAVSDEWRISNLKLVIVDVKNGDVKEIAI